MVFVATITKESVVQLTNDDYQISIHVIIVDEAEIVLLEKDYSERYYSALDVDTIKVKLQDEIASDWDKLVAESDIFDAIQFDTMVNEIQTAANNYINL